MAPDQQTVSAKRGDFVINPGDTIIGRSLVTYGEYAEHELFLLSHVLKPGDTVIDVGANIGTHAVFFSRAVGAAGSVLAIEAQPAIFELLQLNLEKNSCANARAINAACAAEAGRLELQEPDYAREGNFGAYSFKIPEIGRFIPLSETTVQIDALTLDQLEISDCALLKIDAEGMEAEILAGGQQLLETTRPVLYLENNDRERSPELITYLEGLGYSLYWHVISYFRANNHAQCDENIFPAPLELNLVCLPGGQDVGLPLPPVQSPSEWMPDKIGDGAYDIDGLLQLSEAFQ